MAAPTNPDESWSALLVQAAHELGFQREGEGLTLSIWRGGLKELGLEAHVVRRQAYLSEATQGSVETGQQLLTYRQGNMLRVGVKTVGARGETSWLAILENIYAQRRRPAQSERDQLCGFEEGEQESDIGGGAYKHHYKPLAHWLEAREFLSLLGETRPQTPQEKVSLLLAPLERNWQLHQQLAAALVQRLEDSGVKAQAQSEVWGRQLEERHYKRTKTRIIYGDGFSLYLDAEGKEGGIDLLSSYRLRPFGAEAEKEDWALRYCAPLQEAAKQHHSQLIETIFMALQQALLEQHTPAGFFVGRARM